MEVEDEKWERLRAWIRAAVVTSQLRGDVGSGDYLRDNTTDTLVARIHVLGKSAVANPRVQIDRGYVYRSLCGVLNAPVFTPEHSIQIRCANPGPLAEDVVNLLLSFHEAQEENR